MIIVTSGPTIARMRLAVSIPVSYTHLDVYKRQPYPCITHSKSITDISFLLRLYFFHQKFYLPSLRSKLDRVTQKVDKNLIDSQRIPVEAGMCNICLLYTSFANMWMAVFADTGVAMLCVLNSIRILYKH